MSTIIGRVWGSKGVRHRAQGEDPLLFHTCALKLIANEVSNEDHGQLAP
jgi:hypothetical protein